MPASTYTLERDVIYKTTANGTGLKLNLFRPHGRIMATLLYAHGGGFTKGDRNDEVARHFADRLCENGIAIASVDYRLKSDFFEFSPDKQELIRTAQARSLRTGMPINPRFCGPRLYAAVEDMSGAIAFLRHKDGPFAAKSGPLLALGVSAGGIAALALAFPPRGWEDVNRPDSVIGLCAAMVQPWRLAKDGQPSLLVHGFKDRIISPRNARFIARRAAHLSAPLKVVITDTPGHNSQVDLFLNGTDADGQPWLNHARRMMQLPDQSL